MKPQIAALGLFLAAVSTAGAASLRIRSFEPEIELGIFTAVSNRIVIQSTTDLQQWTPEYAFDTSVYPGNVVRLPVAEGVRFFRAMDDTTPLPPDLRWIPAGRFQMGSPNSESGHHSDEGPRREVQIRFGFWMGRYEVTVQQFEELMGFNPSMSPSGSRNPVDNISWDEATEFCRRRTERDRASGAIPAGTAYRLPSEAEWEYACRAGTSTRFSYGEDPEATEQQKYGWNGYNGANRTHEVGSKLPNPWGLYDIHGNVFEWCLDFYGCYPDGQRDTPLKNHVYRGGSWICEPNYLRCASRHPGSQVRAGFIGMRLLLGAPPTTVLVSPEVATPTPILEWSPEATAVTVRAITSTPDASIRYSTNGSIPGAMHQATPPVMTAAGIVKAAGYLECSHRSEPLEVLITQVPPPDIRIAEGRLEWRNPRPDAALEIALNGGGWTSFDAALSMPAHGSLRARARSPGSLTSPEVGLDW